MPLGDLPSVKTAFPDEAHEALRRYVDSTTVSVDDLAMAMQALSMLANTFFSALDASLADRADLRSIATTTRDSLAAEVTRATQAEAALSQRISALEARTLVGTTGQLTKALTVGVGGSTTTFGITYAKPMPSADHVVFVTLDNASASLLGTTSVVLPITNRTAFGCVVTVRNTALLTVASSVTVQVAALQLA